MKAIALLVLSQMLTMGVCMAFGYFCFRRKMLTDHSVREFASLTMRYTIPLSIALSFKDQFRIDRIADWMMVFVFSSLGFLLIIVLMKFMDYSLLTEIMQHLFIKANYQLALKSVIKFMFMVKLMFIMADIKLLLH